eukprot:6373316-Ditylum_brightwellii.AAC.1
MKEKPLSKLQSRRKSNHMRKLNLNHTRVLENIVIYLLIGKRWKEISQKLGSNSAEAAPDPNKVAAQQE